MALLREGLRRTGRFLHRHGKTIAAVAGTVAAVGAAAHDVHQKLQGRTGRLTVPSLPYGIPGSGLPGLIREQIEEYNSPWRR
jgi:hypothetical protein